MCQREEEIEQISDNFIACIPRTLAFHESVECRTKRWLGIAG